jgi:CubicO group peptidase (beta-lactamase class C family)
MYAVQTHHRGFPALLTLLMLLLVRVNAAAQAASIDNRAALEAWLDGTNAILEAHHCAGAVVAIVRNGEVALAKGYGYADLQTRKPVDPAMTLFRIGSVSKLFVWTSVMQMIEQGKLDLNTDVNAYLTDVKVPTAYGAPVTMKHLMTHAAGFEDQVIGLFSHDPKKIRPLGQVLREEMPARVREPGVFASYSNHGTGLAMHVVEQISGEPWER